MSSQELNPKSELNQRCQKELKKAPIWARRAVESGGWEGIVTLPFPELSVEIQKVFTGRAPTKKEAELEAARCALESFEDLVTLSVASAALHTPVWQSVSAQASDSATILPPSESEAQSADGVTTTATAPVPPTAASVPMEVSTSVSVTTTTPLKRKSPDEAVQPKGPKFTTHKMHVHFMHLRFDPTKRPRVLAPTPEGECPQSNIPGPIEVGPPDDVRGFFLFSVVDGSPLPAYPALKVWHRDMYHVDVNVTYLKEMALRPHEALAVLAFTHLYEEVLYRGIDKPDQRRDPFSGCLEFVSSRTYFLPSWEVLDGNHPIDIPFQKVREMLQLRSTSKIIYDVLDKFFLSPKMLRIFEIKRVLNQRQERTKALEGAETPNESSGEPSVELTGAAAEYNRSDAAASEEPTMPWVVSASNIEEGILSEEDLHDMKDSFESAIKDIDSALAMHLGFGPKSRSWYTLGCVDWSTCPLSEADFDAKKEGEAAPATFLEYYLLKGVYIADLQQPLIMATQVDSWPTFITSKYGSDIIGESLFRPSRTKSKELERTKQFSPPDVSGEHSAEASSKGSSVLVSEIFSRVEALAMACTNRDIAPSVNDQSSDTVEGSIEVAGEASVEVQLNAPVKKNRKRKKGGGFSKPAGGNGTRMVQYLVPELVEVSGITWSVVQLQPLLLKSFEHWKEMEKVHIVEDMIGYRFNNKTLLYQALTHESVIGDKISFLVDELCYETLEWIGDDVLKFLTSVHMFQSYATAHEGELTAIRTKLIKNTRLAEIVRMRGWDAHCRRKFDGSLNWGSGDLEADLFESLLGAVFLDSQGDLLVCGRFVRDHLLSVDVILSTQDSVNLPLLHDEAFEVEHKLMSKFCHKIGYLFRNKAYLKQAMLHPRAQHGVRKERLEFLGDAILDFIATCRLHQLFPLAKQQGFFTQCRKCCVANQVLAEAAVRLKVEPLLLLAGGAQGTNPPSVATKAWGDWLEVLVACVYLDSSGGFPDPIAALPTSRTGPGSESEPEPRASALSGRSGSRGGDRLDWRDGVAQARRVVEHVFLSEVLLELRRKGPLVDVGQQWSELLQTAELTTAVVKQQVLLPNNLIQISFLLNGQEIGIGVAPSESEASDLAQERALRDHFGLPPRRLPVPAAQ